MPKYTAQELEKTFKVAASLRISRLKRGNKDVEGDGGYWEGGRCEWGGSHSLKEDCKTIAQGLDKLDELKLAEKELKASTSEQEFNSIKSRLTRQSEELENSLQMKTGSASSMFYVCYIWSCFPGFIESKLKSLRNEVSRFKKEVSGQNYKFYEEIKALKLEQKQIEARMKENKRKAQEEKDPNKKALLLQLIEDDGRKLEENLKKQTKIPTINLRFEPDKYVSDLIESMKKAIESGGGGSKGGGLGGGSRKRGDDSDSDDNFFNPLNPNNNGNSNSNPLGNQKSKFFQENQTLILIGVAVLILFWFSSQKEEVPKKDYFDYDF